MMLLPRLVVAMLTYMYWKVDNRVAIFLILVVTLALTLLVLVLVRVLLISVKFVHAVDELLISHLAGGHGAPKMRRLRTFSQEYGEYELHYNGDWDSNNDSNGNKNAIMKSVSDIPAMSPELVASAALDVEKQQQQQSDQQQQRPGHHQQQHDPEQQHQKQQHEKNFHRMISSGSVQSERSTISSTDKNYGTSGEGFLHGNGHLGRCTYQYRSGLAMNEGKRVLLECTGRKSMGLLEGSIVCSSRVGFLVRLIDRSTQLRVHNSIAS